MDRTDDTSSTKRDLELLEVAQVQPGYLSRRSVRSNPNGTHLLLQAKDINPESGIETDAAVRFVPQRNPQLYQVTCGDILIASRGKDHRAYLITDRMDNTLASNVFYIIRPHVDHVIPNYLAWWLNLPHVQAQIEAGSRGTSIGYISRQTMEHLPVVLPRRDVQSHIARVIDLWRTKKLLQSSLDEKREKLIQAICRHTIQ